MMSIRGGWMINEIKKLNINDVLTSGRIDDWELNPKTEGFHHKVFEDLEIIKVASPDGDFKECFWKDHCEIKEGVNIEYMVKFGDEFISRHFFVEIENIGIVLPLPKLGTHQITLDQLNLAKIINTKVRAEDLIEQARLNIQSLHFEEE
jgi:hypothetical protein